MLVSVEEGAAVVVKDLTSGDKKDGRSCHVPLSPVPSTYKLGELNVALCSSVPSNLVAEFI